MSNDKKITGEVKKPTAEEIKDAVADREKIIKSQQIVKK